MTGTAIAIRHVAFEGLGTIEPLLRARGYEVKIADACAGAVATLMPPDLLIVLGGPIGAYEDAVYPLLADELRLIETQMSRAAPILGICLGAQLMARALGARVYPGPQKEIGWSAITLTSEGESSPLAPYRDGAPVLHWHGDTFDLPAGATRLASTSITTNQAYSIGTTALGLQFHGECDGRDIEHWLVGHAAELASARIDVPALRAASKTEGPRAKAAGMAALSRWLDQLPKEPT
ncbi:MAG: glutamine amidotransferase [Hyphomicrobiaceae bacterium]|nr:glutamine amidotransferase [Hyphomicrobiaceae bacterium]